MILAQRGGGLAEGGIQADHLAVGFFAQRIDTDRPEGVLQRVVERSGLGKLRDQVEKEAAGEPGQG